MRLKIFDGVQRSAIERVSEGDLGDGISERGIIME